MPTKLARSACLARLFRWETAFLDLDCGDAHLRRKHLPAFEREQIRLAERRGNNRAVGPLRRRVVAGLWEREMKDFELFKSSNILQEGTESHCDLVKLIEGP